MTEFYRQYLAVAVFVVAAFAMVGAMLTVARILRPTLPQPEKYITYESGVDPVGTGWAQAPSVVETNVLLTSEFVGRALVYFKLNPRVRLGLGATGSVAYVSGGSIVNGWWQHVEFVLRLDQAMRLPKRIVPGP